MLAPQEQVILEAEAAAWTGPANVLGAGRAYLTDSRLIWLRRATPLIRRFLFWIPEVVEISFSSIETAKLTHQFPRRAWLRIRANGKKHAFRLGEGPFPLLRNNPQTTERWLREIESRRSPSAP